MFCYEVTVETTNPIKNAFQTGGVYHTCIDGTVYVVAKDAFEAAKQIPEAKVIRLVGRAYTPKAGESRGE